MGRGRAEYFRADPGVQKVHKEGAARHSSRENSRWVNRKSRSDLTEDVQDQPHIRVGRQRRLQIKRPARLVGRVWIYKQRTTPGRRLNIERRPDDSPELPSP